MDQLEINEILSTLADLTSADWLWLLFSLMTGLAGLISLIFYCHWYRFIIGRSTLIMVSVLYTVGTILLLVASAWVINLFASS